MVENELLMQFQADILNKPVVRPSIKETTARGAAYAAGLGIGLFENADELCSNWLSTKPGLRRWKTVSASQCIGHGRKLYAVLSIGWTNHRTFKRALLAADCIMNNLLLIPRQ
jgi:hypothetical protein